MDKDTFEDELGANGILLQASTLQRNLLQSQRWPGAGFPEDMRDLELQMLEIVRATGPSN